MTCCPMRLWIRRSRPVFNRNHRGNSEGGIVPEEYLVEYAVDRVDTMSTVFLGVTLGCARCHNHKYDPFTQREYYQMFAYFNNIPELGRYLKYGNTPPVVTAPTTQEQRRSLRSLEAGVEDGGDDLRRSARNIADAQTRPGNDHLCMEPTGMPAMTSSGCRGSATDRPVRRQARCGRAMTRRTLGSTTNLPSRLWINRESADGPILISRAEDKEDGEGWGLVSRSTAGCK